MQTGVMLGARERESQMTPWFLAQEALLMSWEGEWVWPFSKLDSKRLKPKKGTY